MCIIVREVAKALVGNLWTEFVDAKFPRNEDSLRQKMQEMDPEWQFPYAYAAIDGCHIPTKCPLVAKSHAKSSIILRTFSQ